jgi:hypothetical protein
VNVLVSWMCVLSCEVRRRRRRCRLLFLHCSCPRSLYCVIHEKNISILLLYSALYSALPYYYDDICRIIPIRRCV